MQGYNENQRTLLIEGPTPWIHGYCLRVHNLAGEVSDAKVTVFECGGLSTSSTAVTST